MRIQQPDSNILIAFAFGALISGCSSSIRIERTFEDRDYANSEYSNVLVLGASADYEARARFERSLASALRSNRTAATPYYEVAAGDQEVTREKIIAAIEMHGYDGVVVTRIGSQESQMNIKDGPSTAKASRRTERQAIDFFRYDYEVLNEPNQINVASTVLLITDFFNAGDARLIWTAESTVSDKENVSYLVDDAAGAIAGKLRRDGLVAD